jgi:hypothetical protein
MVAGFGSAETVVRDSLRDSPGAASRIRGQPGGCRPSGLQNRQGVATARLDGSISIAAPCPESSGFAAN